MNDDKWYMEGELGELYRKALASMKHANKIGNIKSKQDSIEDKGHLSDWEMENGLQIYEDNGEFVMNSFESVIKSDENSDKVSDVSHSRKRNRWKIPCDTENRKRSNSCCDYPQQSPTDNEIPKRNSKRRSKVTKVTHEYGQDPQITTTTSKCRFISSDSLTKSSQIRNWDRHRQVNRSTTEYRTSSSTQVKRRDQY